MGKTWVNYEAGSAVQQSIAVVNGLESQGKKIIYMHQGAESAALSGNLAQYSSYAGHNTPSYNPAKGLPDARDAMADFAVNFLGLPATRSNTFLLETNGRVELGHAFMMANRQANLAHLSAVSLVPRLRWPMVDNKADDHLTRDLLTYEMDSGDLAKELGRVLVEGASAERKEAGLVTTSIYTNVPHNPTGYRSNQKEMQNVISMLSAHNQKSEYGVLLIDDNPYFANLEQKDEGAFLKSPFEGVQMDDGVPSIHVISFSKALGTAGGGLTGVVITDTKLASTYDSFIATDVGPSFDKANFQNFAALMQETNYPDLRAHFASLHDKYERNHAVIVDKLGQHLLSGEAGMVCTIKVPSDALNKLIDGVDGAKHEITNARKVAEYIANQHGVMVVDQSVGQDAYLRLALKDENTAVIEQGASKIAQAYEELIAAPAIPAP